MFFSLFFLARMGGLFQRIEYCHRSGHCGVYIYYNCANSHETLAENRNRERFWPSNTVRQDYKNGGRKRYEVGSISKEHIG
jgi:hypothetical protein